MKGENTVEFDFTFQYSRGGKFEEGHSITIRAPGLGKYDVHTTMTAYVGRAALAFAKLASSDSGQPAPHADSSAEADQPSGEDQDEQDVMQLMAMGLGVEEFPKFAMYLKRVLTGTPKLARVTDTDVGISDEIWESLEANGGMDAVHRVMSDFTGFFLGSMAARQQKPNGAAPAHSSASPTKAPSPTRQRVNSRLQNS